VLTSGVALAYTEESTTLAQPSPPVPTPGVALAYTEDQWQEKHSATIIRG
jgi:hypothetical protein